MSESQRRHYENIGHEYASAHRNNPANRAFFEYWNRELFALAPRGGRFLDPMCGAGELPEEAVGHYDEVYGTDLSPVMISNIPDDVKRRALFAVGDVAALPFPDGRFDVVMIRGGLHHVHKQLDTVLSEIHRVLVPGGAFVCAEPVDDFFLIRWIRGWMYRVSSFFDDTEEKAFRTPDLVRSLERAGFKVRTVRRFGFFAYTLIGNTEVLGWFRRLRNPTAIRLLIGVDRLMSRIPVLNRVSLTIIFHATKAR